MKKFYLALAAVAAIFAGCSKEVDNQTEPVVPKEKTVTLKASVSGLETKVSSDNAGFFKWQNQDAITVVTDKDATSFFNLFNIDNTGTQADFEGAIADGDALKYALYPASNSHTPDGNELLFNIDDIVTWKADACNMPMLGVATSASTVSFVALGGVLKLVLFNIPADADYLKFSATSKQISGTFYIEDVTVEAPVIATAPKGEGDNIQVIDFSENYSSSKVFYIPLPTGDIDGFTVALYKALDEEPLFSVTSEKTLNVLANKLIIAKSMNCSGASTLWSEDFSDYSANDVPDGGTYSYSCEGTGTKVYDGVLAGGTTPELLVAKGGGSFTASNVPTNGEGELSLSFRENYSRITVSSITEGVEITDGSYDTDSKLYTATVTNANKEASIVLTFTNSQSSNVRVDDIKLSISGSAIANAPVITAKVNETEVSELTFAVGETSKEVTVSLANPVDGLGIGALVTGDNAENFTATIVGNTLTVAALAANPTDAAYAATVTLRASGAAAKTISITQESAVVPNLTNLEATPGDSSAEVTWAGSEHATSYVAYLHTSETETPATGGNDVSSSINGCALSLASLINDQTYYLYVKVDGVETGYVAPSDFVMVSFTPAAAGVDKIYELYSGDITEGDYLIVYGDYAMNTTVESDRLMFVEVTASNDQITNPADNIVWHIAPSGEYWTLYNAEADAYAASTGAKNKAQMLADGTDDKALWTVSETATTATYEFVNKANAAAGVNSNLRKNAAYGFACYATGTGGALSLYKLADNDGREEAGMSWNADAATATYNTGNTLSFSAPTLNLGNASNISFASTDETIATITATGEVTIEALVGNEVKEGSTTIKAIFDGDDNYKPQTVSYTLSVVDGRDAVDAPTFSPAAGEVEANAQVTINSVSGATVYYTLNGAVPTTGSTEYTGPITIDEAKTIKAIAVLTGYKTSEVAEAAYTVAGVQSNDGTLEHPYTATDVLGLASASNVYVTGTIKSITEVSTSYHNATYTITDGESDALVFRGKYLNNANFTSEDQIAVGDVVIVYGNISQYNNVSQVSQNNYLYSINGKTKALTAGTLTATPDNDNKQITVEWGAATGTESAISYVVTCGTLSYNATAAGSHTFTMADYGSYQVSVTASADDAISATASTSATLTDPSSGGGDEPTIYTYTFTSKAWGDSTNSWDSGKDGNQMTSGRGVQVTTGATGANATTKSSFSGVSKVVVTYSTNASNGAGSIAIKVGSNDAHSQNVTKTGGTTDRTLTYDIDPSETGNVKITVTCSTNSIYVKGVEITAQ